MSQRYFLTFHLGPVQDFIAMARRTQDLWMGSWILSYLSHAAMRTVESKGGVLVLPGDLPSLSDKNADAPNKFTAMVDSEAVAQAAETAVRCQWTCLARKVKEEFFKGVPDSLWNRQVQSFLEVYWAVCPIGDDEKQARNFAQVALDARKRVRNFVETCGELGEKCTLCGQRQALCDKDETRQGVRKFWQDLAKRRGDLRVRSEGRERLCAVCAIKRCALAAKALPPLQHLHGKQPFPSTSSVAAARFKLKLASGAGATKLKAHLDLLSEWKLPADVDDKCLPLLKTRAASAPAGLLTYDGDLFYSEAFTTKRMTEEYPEVVECLTTKLAEDWGVSPKEAEEQLLDEEISRCAAGLRELYVAVGEKPSKYFACLAMDGDHMGQVLSEADDPSAISTALSDFATQRARKVVEEEHCGRLVYAGGDDVLALLPLEDALPAARQLQEEFKAAVAQLPPKRPTPSIGIAIAHHTQPLEATLSAMRRAESEAKNHYGRDALCVHLLKRSGEEVQVGTHWRNGCGSLVGLAEEAVKRLNADALSMKFPHAVFDEARALADLPVDARIAELKRLAKRHKGKSPDEAGSAEFAARLAEWSEVEHGDKEKRPLGLEEVARWLLLARFIASGGRDSE